MRFRLLGVPVYVRPIFWLMAVFLGMPNDTSPKALMSLGIWVGVVFVSVLVHEMGHALAMRAFGSQPSIELWGMGGLTHWGQGAEPSPWRSILVSLAGPGAGFVVAALTFAVSIQLRPAAGSLGATLVRDALWVNLGWGILNLLPMLPLDGGRALESFGSWVGGKTGRRVVHLISTAIAGSAAALAVSRGMWWAAFIAGWCAMLSLQTLLGPARAAGPQIRPELLAPIQERLVSGDLAGAVAEVDAKLSGLPDDPPHAFERAQLCEIKSWALLRAGDRWAARKALDQLPPGQAPNPLLLARLALGSGDLEHEFTALERAYRSDQNAFSAQVLVNAYLEHRRPQKVVDLMDEAGRKLGAEAGLTIASQLFNAGHFAEAFEVSRMNFQRFRQPHHAYNAACALSRLGRSEEAMEWLVKALRAGFSDAEQLSSDADLAPLRSHPRWAEVTRLAGS